MTGVSVYPNAATFHLLSKASLVSLEASHNKPRYDCLDAEIGMLDSFDYPGPIRSHYV